MSEVTHKPKFSMITEEFQKIDDTLIHQQELLEELRTRVDFLEDYITNTQEHQPQEECQEDYLEESQETDATEESKEEPVDTVDSQIPCWDWIMRGFFKRNKTSTP